MKAAGGRDYDMKFYCLSYRYLGMIESSETIMKETVLGLVIIDGTWTSCLFDIIL